MKAGGDDDDDDDDDDDRDGKDDRGKDVCKASSWVPPLINFQTKSCVKIKFCQAKPKDTESCDVQAARYVDDGQWTNFTDFQRKFWTKKNKKDIYLEVNKAIRVSWDKLLGAPNCEITRGLTLFTLELISVGGPL